MRPELPRAGRLCQSPRTLGTGEGASAPGDAVGLLMPNCRTTWRSGSGLTRIAGVGGIVAQHQPLSGEALAHSIGISYSPRYVIVRDQAALVSSDERTSARATFPRAVSDIGSTARVRVAMNSCGSTLRSRAYRLRS